MFGDKKEVKPADLYQALAGIFTMTGMVAMLGFAGGWFCRGMVEDMEKTGDLVDKLLPDNESGGESRGESRGE